MPDPKPRAASRSIPGSIEETLSLLEGADYVADRALATVLFLALRLKRPLFLEGEAGVGKTEIAKVLASALGRRLIRLQCYEGLDVSSAVYEWNYAAQMIEIRMEEAEGKVDRSALEKNVFSERYLIRRPVLDALTGEQGAAPVFLIDELDRTDEAFEASCWKSCRTTRSLCRNSARSRPRSLRSSLSPPTVPAKSTTP
jgi:MoxR-like ATPase